MTRPSLRLLLLRPAMIAMRWAQARFPVEDAQAFVSFRGRAERLAGLVLHPPRGVAMEKAILGDVAGEWLIPEHAPDDPVLLFLHGGGILFGWGGANRHILGYLAQFSGLRGFGVDYRLAPEYGYPAAHNDCYAVYEKLVRQGKRVVLIGESSGGVLALAILLRARARGLPQPPLCALLSPTVDYGFRDGRVWQYEDAFAHPKFVVEMHRHYIGSHDTMQPDLAPVYADLTGLASLVVLAGGRELLRGEVERLIEAAQRYEVGVQYELWPEVWHAWHLFVPFLPEATNALKWMGRVIQERLGN
jgi:acetyl esterase/lipase